MCQNKYQPRNVISVRQGSHKRECKRYASQLVNKSISCYRAVEAGAKTMGGGGVQKQWEGAGCKNNGRGRGAKTILTVHLLNCYHTVNATAYD